MQPYPPVIKTRTGRPPHESTTPMPENRKPTDCRPPGRRSQGPGEPAVPHWPFEALPTTVCHPRPTSERLRTLGACGRSPDAPSSLWWTLEPCPRSTTSGSRTCDATFEDTPFRTPLKFGGRVVDGSQVANVAVTVETADGRRAVGEGSMPLGNVWGWPSPNVAPTDAAEAVPKAGSIGRGLARLVPRRRPPARPGESIWSTRSNRSRPRWSPNSASRSRCPN